MRAALPAQMIWLGSDIAAGLRPKASSCVSFITLRYHLNVSAHSNGNFVVWKERRVNVMEFRPTWEENVFGALRSLASSQELCIVAPARVPHLSEAHVGN